MRFPTFLLSAFLFLAPVCAAEDRPALRVGGSDLFGESFRQTLEDFSDEHGTEVLLSLKGSFRAQSALRRGEIDLAVVALPAGQEERLESYEAHVLAYQTVIFCVPASNDLDGLTLRQAAGIFGASEPDSYSRWRDLGAGEALSPRTIALYSIASGRSIAVDLFRHEVLRTPRLRSGVAFFDSVGETLSALENDEAGIALLPTVPPGDRTLRVLSLARGDEDIAFGPSPENIHAGDYPIRLPVYLVFQEDAREKLQDLLVFLSEDDATAAVEESGLVPLPESARIRFRMALE